MRFGIGSFIRRAALRVRNGALRHPRFTWCLAGCIALVIISLIALLVNNGFSFDSVVPVFSGIQVIEFMKQLNHTGPGLGLAILPTNVDIPGGTMTINWWPVGCNESNNLPLIDWFADAPPPDLVSLGCGGTPESYTVWIDLKPYWSWNASGLLLHLDQNTRAQFQPEETFNTNHDFISHYVGETLGFRRQHSESAWYPFDYYATATIIEAFDNATGSALPIYFANLYGGVTSYRISVNQTTQVTTPRTELGLYLEFVVKHSVAVKLFAMALCITNYVLTLGMICIAICAFLGQELPESILLLPLTNILALPQLRAAMPDIPDFGIFIDIFGYDVNIIAVVFAALFIVLKMVRKSNPKPERPKEDLEANDRITSTLPKTGGPAEGSRRTNSDEKF